MRVTSSEANKLLRQFDDEKRLLYKRFKDTAQFHCAVGEDIKDCETKFDLMKILREIDAVNKKITKLKHAISVFNTTTEVRGEMTIDQVLVRLPELQELKVILDDMRKKLPRERYGINGNVIDYVYTAYDPTEANAEFLKVTEEIKDLQVALDRINTTVTFDF